MLPFETEWPAKYLIRFRILEGLREVGVLVVAFAPLDIALSEGGLEKHWPTLVGFWVVGTVLFFYAVLGERRLVHAR